MVEVTATIEPGTRKKFRAWLQRNHAKKTEIWLLYFRNGPPRHITYLDIVEECMCFGWVDGIAKRVDEHLAQRLTPRKAKSHWTELNKERARRLIEAGLMTSAGESCLPDLDPKRFRIPEPIEAALRSDPECWSNFSRFPALYQRVRVGYVAEMLKRDPIEYDKRLRNFIDKTRANKMFGNWDDTKLKVTR
ncbi:MAG: YdeI/OmpD-associated family protein [Myxococcota bacterium]